MPITQYDDGGHSWYAVPKAAVLASKASVSPYSYVSADGKTVYLEEDCDYGAFLKAVGLDRVDVPAILVDLSMVQGECFIRRLRPFRCPYYVPRST